MAERNFDAEYPLVEETHVFTLGGQEFHVSGVLHPALFLDREEGVAGLISFVSGCLVQGEAEVFTALVSDFETKVTAEQLGNLVTWIIEQVSERPTTAPDSSGATVASVS